MTVDIKRKSARRTRPQSWNRYAYAANDPVGRRDPSGLCDLAVAGIDQSATSQSSKDVASYGSTQVTVYPFSNGANLPFGLGIGTGVGNVVLGANSNATGVVIGLIEAAAQGGPINVTTFSGGAQAFTSAVNYLNQNGEGAITSLIGNITYVSPGANGTLYNNGSAVILEGSTILDASAMFGTMSGTIPIMPQAPGCGHDFGCIVKFYSGFVAGRQGAACEDPFTIQQNDSSGFLNLLPGPLDVVDGSITGDNPDWEILPPAEEPMFGASSTISYPSSADDGEADDE